MPSTWRHAPFSSRLLEWLLGRRMSNFVLLVLALVPLGTLGYVLFGGLGWLDALYQTMITLSTVGFQDMAPSTGGRIFTIFFVAFGVGVFVVMLSSLAAYLVEGRLREAIGRRRMEREISHLKGHIILCGLGRFGQMTALELLQRDVPFAVIDTDPVKVVAANERGILAMQADATEDESLERAGIHDARGIISTLDSDAGNVYVALTAKQMRPDVTVITVAREPHAEPKLRAAGADAVISPYAVGALDLARRMLQPHVSEFLAGTRGGLRFRLEEVPVRAGSALVHQKLRDTRLRQAYGVTVIAIVKTRQEAIHDHPDPDTELEAGDVLIAVGSPDGLKKLEEACASPRA